MIKIKDPRKNTVGQADPISRLRFFGDKFDIRGLVVMLPTRHQANDGMIADEGKITGLIHLERKIEIRPLRRASCIVEEKREMPMCDPAGFFIRGQFEVGRGQVTGLGNITPRVEEGIAQFGGQ